MWSWRKALTKLQFQILCLFQGQGSCIKHLHFIQALIYRSWAQLDRRGEGRGGEGRGSEGWWKESSLCQNHVNTTQSFTCLHGCTSIAIKTCCNFSAVDYIKGTRHVNKGSTLLASYRTAFLSNSQEESKNRFD